MIDNELKLYKIIKEHFYRPEKVLQFKADTILFQERDPVENIYLILNGSVSVGSIHLKGKEFTMKILNGQEILVEYQLFNPDADYHFYGKAISDCDVLVINRLQFENFLKNNQDILILFTDWLSTRYLKAQVKAQDLIMNGKKGALYSIMIRLANSYGIMTDEGIEIDLPLTHQEFANLTFGTREVIQRMFKELRELDVIDYNQQVFLIKDLAFLKHHVDCQNCPYEICGLN